MDGIFWGRENAKRSILVECIVNRGMYISSEGEQVIETRWMHLFAEYGSTGAVG